MGEQTTLWQLCSHCNRTHFQLAADILSSRALVLTGLVPERGSPAPGTYWGTLFSRHSCQQMHAWDDASVPNAALMVGIAADSCVAPRWCHGCVMVPIWGIGGGGGEVWGCNSFWNGELKWFNETKSRESIMKFRCLLCKNTLSNIFLWLIVGFFCWLIKTNP